MTRVGEQRTSGPRSRVILIGGSGSTVEGLRVALPAGLDVLLVNSCEAATELLAAGVPVQAVVMEAESAQGEALEAYRQCIGSRPPGVETIVLVDQGSPAIEAMAAWAGRVVRKPIPPGALREIVLEVTREALVRFQAGKADGSVERALVRRTRGLEVAQIVTTEIVRELDLARLRGLIVRGARDLVDARGVVLWGIDPRRRDRLVVLESVNVTLTSEEREGIPIEVGVGTTFPSCERVLTLLGQHVDRVEPLVYRGELVGALGIVAPGSETGRPAYDDQDVLGWFASSTAMALKNAYLHAETVREVSAVLSGVQNVLAAANVQEMVEHVAVVVAEIVACPTVQVLLWDDSAEVLRVAAVRGAGGQVGDVVPRVDTIAGQAAESRGVVCGTKDGDAGKLAIPLRTPSKVVGVVVVSGVEGAALVPEAVVRRLTAFIEHAALAIERARAHEDLRAAYQTQERVQESRLRMAKLQALGQLAAGVAHEINNLLMVIGGRAETVASHLVDPDSREAMTDLQRATSDCVAVVRRIQVFARQEEEHEALWACDLADLVWESLELTRTRWQDEPARRGATIAVVRRLRGLPPVLGTPSEIREVITNLVLNAVDAMPVGGTLTFDGSEVHDSLGRHWVELRVSDTGGGIPESMRERIFDPFFTTKGMAGMGLGLSVAYGILKRLGGSIGIEETGATGTTLRLRFVQDAARGTTVAAGEPRRRVWHVLIVDDERQMRRLFRTLLQSVGYRVSDADGAEDAVRIVREQAIDLVVTDVRMPGRDGLYVVDMVRRLRPTTKVIVVSAFPECVTAAKAVQVDAALGKPIPAAVMVETIARVLGGTTPLEGGKS